MTEQHLILFLQAVDTEKQNAQVHLSHLGRMQLLGVAEALFAQKLFIDNNSGTTSILSTRNPAAMATAAALHTGFSARESLILGPVKSFDSAKDLCRHVQAYSGKKGLVVIVGEQSEMAVISGKMDLKQRFAASATAYLTQISPKINWTTSQIFTPQPTSIPLTH